MPMVTNTMKLPEVATPHGNVKFDPATWAGEATAEQAAFLAGLPGYVVSDAPAEDKGKKKAGGAQAQG